jgi:transposase
MMGIKERTFQPLPENISLEDLVPEDNFYRRLQERLDLSFVRELVEDLYAPSGRPSIDPEVFFRLQMVMFHEGIRSERELMRVVCDRLSARWYVGYDLFEALPDHSSLTRIRDRAVACRSSGSFSSESWSCASKPGWFGARSCTSTPQR